MPPPALNLATPLRENQAGWRKRSGREREKKREMGLNILRRVFSNGLKSALIFREEQ